MKLPIDGIRDLAKFYVSRRKLDKDEQLDFDVRELPADGRFELRARYLRVDRAGSRRSETVRRASYEIDVSEALVRQDDTAIVDAIREAARYLVLQVAPGKPPAFRIRPPHFARRRALAILRSL